MTASPLRRTRRAALLGAAVAALVLGLTTQFSYGGLNAGVQGSKNTAGSATLAYTHNYTSGSCTSVPSGKIIGSTSTFSCSGSPVPSKPAPATGTVTGTDTITANGSVAANQVGETVAAASCAPVNLANNATSGNPLLARYGTSFSTVGPVTGSGAITLDGANPGGYETSVVTQRMPSAGLLNPASYGFGIWFKAAAVNSGGGPLFGSGASAGNLSAVNDRELVLTSSGQLTFAASATSTITTPAGTDYRTGTGTGNGWHFAYVRISISVLGVMSAAIYVDGSTTAVMSGNALTPTPVYSGYWHVGQSPAVSGSATYFPGSLSNFVVFTNNPAPAAPTKTDLASQASFESWSSGATDRWRLNDSGLTTFAGPYPAGGTTSPCAAVNVSVGTATSCAYTPASGTTACPAPSASLSGFADGKARSLASVAPTASQTLTFTLARGSGYSIDFDPGLRLYTPLTFTATSGGWVNTFTWADSSSVFLA